MEIAGTVAGNQEDAVMHITHPSRLIPFPPARAPSERRITTAMVVFALVLLGGSLWFSRHGVSFVPCGEDAAATCQ